MFASYDEGHTSIFDKFSELETLETKFVSACYLFGNLLKVKILQSKWNLNK